ncbi:hypothetical protein L1987_05235 [Smallanthus sonchifolius]|uniref:Uncharacterized protein n=1 Tax=Smallanthus sonchifolius TaxID=185202 RepID=A0ACB9JUX4_9ASTR|nr:hypothetical protein L1987_05235 [Smallanthus sonchifolius]
MIFNVHPSENVKSKESTLSFIVKTGHFATSKNKKVEVVDASTDCKAGLTLNSDYFLDGIRTNTHHFFSALPVSLSLR